MFHPSPPPLWTWCEGVESSDVEEEVGHHPSWLPRWRRLQISSRHGVDLLLGRICEAIGAKRPTTNFSEEDRKAVSQLRGDKDIQVLQADKGNAIVILNATDYDRKVHALLDYRASYAVLKKDPIRATERNLLFLFWILPKGYMHRVWIWFKVHLNRIFHIVWVLCKPQ